MRLTKRSKNWGKERADQQQEALARAFDRKHFTSEEEVERPLSYKTTEVQKQKLQRFQESEAKQRRKIIAEAKKQSTWTNKKEEVDSETSKRLKALGLA